MALLPDIGIELLNFEVNDLPVDADILSHRTQIRLLSYFSTKHNINKVYLFGSRARGDHRPGSDIDLIFDCQSWDLTIRNSFASQIDDLNLANYVDLVDLNKIKKSQSWPLIEKEMILIYEKPI